MSPLNWSAKVWPIPARAGDSSKKDGNAFFPPPRFFVAEDPSRVLPAVCNALYNLTATLDANPDQWLDDMERMATACRNADEFLKCGKVAAWRAGLAHFREGAIDAAKTLTETLARVSLSAPLHVPLPALFERLGRDPWFNPGNTDDAEHEAGSRLRTVCRAGAFRGFGGLFPEPPLVAPSGEHFLVKSGSECWLLIADIFGATFHRSDPAEFKTSGRSGLPSGITIKRTTVRCNGLSLELSDLGNFTSVAANSHTLALTSLLTHAVTLLALI